MSSSRIRIPDPNPGSESRVCIPGPNPGSASRVRMPDPSPRPESRIRHLGPESRIRHYRSSLPPHCSLPLTLWIPLTSSPTPHCSSPLSFRRSDRAHVCSLPANGRSSLLRLRNAGDLHMCMDIVHVHGRCACAWTLCMCMDAVHVHGHCACAHVSCAHAHMYHAACVGFTLSHFLLCAARSGCAVGHPVPPAQRCSPL